MTPNYTSPKKFYEMQQLLIKGLLLLSILCIAALAQAQSNRSLATQAAQLCQEQALDEAIAVSRSAIQDPTESQLAYTWYVHGFVCKELYKTRESHLRQSGMRKEAIDAFLIAETKQSKAEISTSAPLRYLITTLHNDALMSANEFKIETESEPDTLFEQYRKLATATSLHTSDNIKESEIQFLKTKAQHYFELWSNQSDSDYCNTMAIKCYSTILEKSPNDCISVYNIGVAYYDQAALQAQIEGLHLNEMTRVQIAHSYFTKANELCPDDTMIQTAFKLTANTAQPTDASVKKLSIKKNR